VAGELIFQTFLEPALNATASKQPSIARHDQFMTPSTNFAGAIVPPPTAYEAVRADEE